MRFPTKEEFVERKKEALAVVEQKVELPDKIWMVRSCHLYDEEYRDCKSFRSRFQQYFVEGKIEDCNPWYNDYCNCLKWKQEKDRSAVDKLIESEEARRHKRLDPHYNNPVWENRSEPPSNWNAPLPPFLAAKQKDSYLELKAKEMSEGKLMKPDKICVIM